MELIQGDGSKMDHLREKEDSRPCRVSLHRLHSSFRSLPELEKMEDVQTRKKCEQIYHSKVDDGKKGSNYEPRILSCHRDTARAQCYRAAKKLYWKSTAAQHPRADSED